MSSHRFRIYHNYFMFITSAGLSASWGYLTYSTYVFDPLKHKLRSVCDFLHDCISWICWKAHVTIFVFVNYIVNLSSQTRQLPIFADDMIIVIL